MLSYRHAFHAGGHTDILKHLVLANTLQYATRKETPLFYLDTHAGAGLYRISSEAAQKTGEAAAGIRKLDLSTLIAQTSAEGRVALEVFQKVLTPFLNRGQYPGSPLIATSVLRRQDHLHLFELHSTDYRLLLTNTEHDKRVQCEQADGFQSVTALIPPVQKRAVILIDPSYELKGDYSRSAQILETLYQRMPTAQALLWYPVVQRASVDWMLESLLKSNVRDLWQFELGMKADTDSYGMTASGMLVVNPPWVLPEQLRACLPHIQRQLSEDAGHWKVANLIGERPSQT